MVDDSTNRNPKLYIVLLNVHGLIRAQDLELGSDADTGGQTKYVIELTEALAKNKNVARVDLLTRQVIDAKVADSYAVEKEKISKHAQIVRLPCGPKRYLRKESLWPYLDCFADNVLRYIRLQGVMPSVIHAHYADAGYVGCRVASLLDVPLIFTGHSLGREKQRLLLEKGQSAASIEEKYNISTRIEAEEETLSFASLVVASTTQEIKTQYAQYDHYQPSRKIVIPPGTDLNKFYPPATRLKKTNIQQEIEKFLVDKKKPILLALARPDERKNLNGLVEAYGESEQLQALTNLVIIAGNREKIADLDRGARNVWRTLIALIDEYDLYGKVAYPKQHSPEEVGDIYRLAVYRKGVFVNSALTEPFGLTLIEAAATGLPIVATNDGGPKEIIRNCKHGVLVNALSTKDIVKGLLSILENPKIWQQFSDNGQYGARQYYTWGGHAQHYVERVQELIGNQVKSKNLQAKRIKKIRTDRVLISDIDGTLVGDKHALQKLKKLLTQHETFAGFGVATGRTIKMTLDVLNEWDIPIPDILITSVGSEIYYGPNIAYDMGWHQLIDYRWEPQRLRKFMKKEKGISLQEGYKQRTFKISYDVDERFAGAKSLRTRLRKNGLHANVIYSHGQYLDLLPLRASKGFAVRYFADKWGIPLEKILVAGDSGNDLDMMVGRTMGVVVGNHEPELEKLRNLESVYFANGEHAKGILEAIKYFDFYNHRV